MKLPDIFLLPDFLDFKEDGVNHSKANAMKMSQHVIGNSVEMQALSGYGKNELTERFWSAFAAAKDVIGYQLLKNRKESGSEKFKAENTRSS